MLAAGDKKDKYDTKGLIFIHNNDKEKAKTKSNTQKENVSSSSEEVKNKKEKTKQKKNKKSKKEKKEEANNQQQTNSSLPVIETPQAPAIKPVTRINGVDLMPLDDIKKPDLKPHGYSIFSE